MGRGFAVTIAGVSMVSNVLWATLTAFLIMPVIQLAAPRLMMLRRVAFRIALALTVPLVILGGALDLLGAAPRQLLIYPQLSLLLWLLVAAAMAFWAGVLANRMYVPRTKRPAPPNTPS